MLHGITWNIINLSLVKTQGPGWQNLTGKMETLYWAALIWLMESWTTYSRYLRAKFIRNNGRVLVRKRGVTSVPVRRIQEYNKAFQKSTLKTFPGTEVLVEILFCRICLDFVFLLGILSDYVIYILYQIPQVKVLIWR